MTNDGILLEGMKMLKKFGGMSAVHAENDTLINEMVANFNAEGKKDVYAFIESHQPYTETEAVLRYIYLARIAGCKSHVVHCSVPDGSRAIYAAKQEGVDITVETCPQYLGLCEDDLIRLGGVAKCDPPMRPQTMVEDLWDCVLSGKVDMIASDHSPHPSDRKYVDKENFPYAAEGVSGLETLLPVMLDDGVAKRGMKLTQVALLTSENVARRFGLYGRKGALAVGFDADFNIVDMNKTWTCKAENMHYLNKHTPFDGHIFQGCIDETYVRGVLVSKDRDIKVEPGFGKFYSMIMD
jgi:allantoinase